MCRVVISCVLIIPICFLLCFLCFQNSLKLQILVSTKLEKQTVRFDHVTVIITTNQWHISCFLRHGNPPTLLHCPWWIQPRQRSSVWRLQSLQGISHTLSLLSATLRNRIIGYLFKHNSYVNMRVKSKSHKYNSHNLIRVVLIRPSRWNKKNKMHK